VGSERKRRARGEREAVKREASSNILSKLQNRKC
jgi:hypothetical protein